MGTNVTMTVADLHQDGEEVSISTAWPLKFSFRDRHIQQQIKGGFGWDQEYPYRYPLEPNTFSSCHKLENGVEGVYGSDIPYHGWIKPSDLQNLAVPQDSTGDLIRLIAGWSDRDKIVLINIS